MSSKQTKNKATPINLVDLFQVEGLFGIITAYLCPGDIARTGHTCTKVRSKCQNVVGLCCFSHCANTVVYNATGSHIFIPICFCNDCKKHKSSLYCTDHVDSLRTCDSCKKHYCVDSNILVPCVSSNCGLYCAICSTECNQCETTACYNHSHVCSVQYCHRSCAFCACKCKHCEQRICDDHANICDGCLHRFCCSIECQLLQKQCTSCKDVKYICKKCDQDFRCTLCTRFVCCLDTCRTCYLKPNIEWSIFKFHAHRVLNLTQCTAVCITFPLRMNKSLSANPPTKSVVQIHQSIWQIAGHLPPQQSKVLITKVNSISYLASPKLSCLFRSRVDCWYERVSKNDKSMINTYQKQGLMTSNIWFCLIH